MTLQKKSNNDFTDVFNKKNLSNQKPSSISNYGAFIFTLLFIGGFFSSMIFKDVPVENLPPIQKPTFSVVNQNLESYINKNVFNPDLIISSVLNYKTTQTISKSSYKGYLNSNEIIDFNSFKEQNPDNIIDAGDIMTSINEIKYTMIEEDLSIVPFKSGEVSIESEIIETIQSQNYYMVVVLKTFTQNKKAIKVLQKKAFYLKDLEVGLFRYYKNYIYTSSQYNTK